MNVSTPNKIISVALTGHGSEGKTTLAEAMLYAAGLIDRQGRVEDGSTTTDYDPEETKRQISISTAMAPLMWKDVKFNVIDAPGYFDFAGELASALAFADAALIAVGAVAGVVVGTEKAFDICKKNKIPRMFVVNSMDRENASFEKTLAGLKDKFGTKVVTVQLPIMDGTSYKGVVDVIRQKALMFDGKNIKEADIPANLADEAQAAYDALVEAAAETDEELLDKFFGGEALSTEEVIKGLHAAVLESSAFPVCVTAAPSGLGVKPLLDAMLDLLPRANEMPAKLGKNPKTGAEEKRAVDAAAPLSVQVLKSVADAFVGKISLFKIYSGTISSDSPFYNANAEKAEKVGTLYIMRGKKLVNVDKLCAGDIGAVAKLANTSTSDTLCDPANPIVYEPVAFPQPCISLAVTAKKEGEEDKVFAGLHRLEEEDPTFKLEKDVVTGDTIISGLGEMHLDIVCQKLKNKFNVEAMLQDPKIPYRETIRKAVKAEGKHKKQSGGHGQYGHCWIEFEPITDGSAEFEFVDKVVGGVVPRQFIPAVEKGLREAIVKGVLAGYPMVGLRCTLYDGSFHAVDSSEMAFKMAARIAYKKGCALANPMLLEPIYRCEVMIPDEYMGDIIGDMNRRRGRIMGMNPQEDGQQVVVEVPLSEVFKYATDLRSMTQARGSFTLTFERYEEVPANIAQKIIEQAKKDLEEDE